MKYRETDILDNASIVSKPKNGKLSLIFFLFTLSTILYTFVQTLGIKFMPYSTNIQMLISLAFMISTICGITTTVKSFKQKEIKTIPHMIGHVGNILFFLFLIVLVIYLIIDLKTIF